jgi:hypothetical protein
MRSSASPFGGQEEDGRRDRFAQIPGEAEAVLARHHHVEDDEVEIEPCQQAPRMGRVAGSRGHEAVAHEELLQQPADAFVIVDDQEVRADIHHGPPSPSR